MLHSPIYNKRPLSFFLFLLLWGVTGAAVAFEDPIHKPAIISGDASSAHSLVAVTTAGDRLVAVGARGVVIVSDNNGETWQQVSVPVSIDLVDVHFPTARDGWAVGHSGVVIHSNDGGSTWTKQLDREKASALMEQFYKKDHFADNPMAENALHEASYVNEGGHPLLGVWFKNKHQGLVVGAFGIAFKTADGGKTWLPIYHQFDNPFGTHLNAISGDGGHVFVASEQGIIFHLNPSSEIFEAVETPYTGTFFGLVYEERPGLLAFGMNGNIYRSQDHGANWVRVEITSDSSITGGVAISESVIALVTRDASLYVSGETVDQMIEVEGVRTEVYDSYADVTAVDDGKVIVVVGQNGVTVKSLDNKTKVE